MIAAHVAASAVIRIGRSRIDEASRIASSRDFPSARRRIAKSIIRIEKETTIPTIRMIPISDWMLIRVPVRKSIQSTPMSPNGTANITTSGSRSERNWTTRTR